MSLSDEPSYNAEVADRWPGPIAHEYRRLYEMLRDGKYTAAILQLRDVGELLVKLPTAVMLRDLSDRDWPAAQKLAKQLFFSEAALGTWLTVGRELAQLLLSSDAPAPSLPLAACFRRPSAAKKKPFSELGAWFDSLVAFRNAACHGSLALDGDAGLKRELLNLWDGLNAATATFNPWAALALRVFGEDDDLNGFGSMPARRGRLSAQNAEPPEWPDVFVRTGDGPDDVGLGPYVAVRLCGEPECRRLDLYFFNGLDRDRVSFVDYFTGHTLKHPDARHPDVRAERDRLGGDPRDPNQITGSTDSDYVDLGTVGALENALADKDYIPPEYLLGWIRSFIDDHDRGVLWLTAPAHTGKTTMASRLASELHGTVRVAVLHVRREYNCRQERWDEFVRSSILRDVFNERSQSLLPWRPGTGPSPADAFVDLLRSRTREHPDVRLLVCIDGLDELPKPAAGEWSIADFLPPADRLPENVYLLLTSRPRPDTDPAIWHELERSGEGKRAARLSVAADHPGYRALLRRYLTTIVRRIDADRWFEPLLDRADGTFLYFAHLCRLLADKRIDVRQLEELPKGEHLFAEYLDRLRHDLGDRHFYTIERVLCVLAAAEEAHDALVRVVPAGFVDTAWRGLPVPVLAGLLDELWTGGPGRGAPLRLVYSLALLREVLRTWRADDAPYAHYRIGLKGLVQTLRQDVAWSARIDAAHHRIAAMLPLLYAGRYAEGAATRPADGKPVDPLGRYLLSAHLPHGLAIRNRTDDSLGEAVSDLPGEWHDSLWAWGETSGETMDLYSAVQCHSQLLVLAEFIAAAENAGPQALNEVAGILSNRGNARGTAGDVAGAIADYTAAIGIREGLRADLEPWGQWQVGLRNDLASAYSNRGVARRAGGDVAGAIADYTAAIDIGEGLRADLEPRGQWQVGLRNGLASAYNNRGVARGNGGDVAGAIADFTAAIGIGEGLRADLEPRGQWQVGLRNDLASAYSNRGVARGNDGDVAGAIADFTAAIGIRDGLRADLEPGGRWTSLLRLDLAVTLVARANASRGTQAAVDDAREAVTLLTGLVAGDIPSPMRSRCENLLTIAREISGQ